MTIVFLALALLILSLISLWVSAHDERKRLARLKNRLSMLRESDPINHPTQSATRKILDPSDQVRMLIRKFYVFGMKRSWAIKSDIIPPMIIGMIIGSIIFSVCVLAFGWPMLYLTPISLAVCYVIPRIFLGLEQSRGQHQFINYFPDAVDSVCRMLRAGLPISTAIQSIAKDGPPTVRDIFKSMHDQMRIGIPLDEALDSSSTLIGLTDFRFFAVVVALHRFTGGNLTATLEMLSDIIRKRRAVRLKASASTGEIRVTAYTLAALPILTTGCLLIIKPTYLATLWVDPRGQIILETAVMLLVLAGVTIRWMMRSVMSE